MELFAMVPIVLAEGSIVFVIVLIISVISWIVNLAQGNNPKGKPKGRDAQSELEKFLRSVTQQGPAEEPRPAPKQQKPRQKQADKKANRPKTPQRSGPAPAPVPERPGARLSQTHLESSIGVGLSSSGPGVGAAVQHDIVEAVQRDMGHDGTVGTARVQEHPLIQTLRNPVGVRQAILLTEILNRPSRRGSAGRTGGN